MEPLMSLRSTTLLALAFGMVPAIGAGQDRITTTRADATPASVLASGITLEWGVKIPLHDGSILNATLYRPKPDRGPVPCIYYMTPYIGDLSHARGMYFARNGYVFLNVDTRGRGNSPGKFEPFVNEAAEGYDIIEWMAKQPWCNGKVTMWGGSYGGFSQWAAASRKPPHLLTIVPVASAMPGVDFPFLRNVFRTYMIQWSTYTSGVAAQPNLFGDGEFWLEKYADRYFNHRAHASLDTLTGNLTTQFQTWLAHPVPDGYWDAMTPTASQYAAIDLPILTISGYFDGDQIGALTFYRRHLTNATAAARAKHYLILGPWDHPGTRTPVKTLGGLTFGDGSVLDMNQLHKEWYDWNLKGGERPGFLERRVAYWVMGAERWKYADSLEAISDSTMRLALDSREGDANDIFGSGKLVPGRAASAAPDSYRYDPLDTRPGTIELNPTPDYFLDQRAAVNLFGQGVVYHSEPFAEATEITGVPKLTVWMSMDVPDTDFELTLYEIRPDGSSIRLSDDFMRARYRDSDREAKPVPLGQPVRYRFERGMFFSREIRKGSRLRMVLRALNSMSWEKNYNSGGAVARETGKDARTATVRIYHDPEHPSVLELPVVRPLRS
jgi:putative CocE/NonD family hydrolase